MIVHAVHTAINGHPVLIAHDNVGRLIVMLDEEPDPIVVTAAAATLAPTGPCRVCDRDTHVRDELGRSCCAQCQRIEATLMTLPHPSEYLPSAPWQQERGDPDA